MVVLGPPSLSWWPKYFKFKLKGKPITHACWEMIRIWDLFCQVTFWLAHYKEANKKQEKSVSFNLNKNCLSKVGLETSFAWLLSKKWWAFQASFLLSMGYTQFGLIWGTKLKKGKFRFQLSQNSGVNGNTSSFFWITQNSGVNGNTSFFFTRNLWPGWDPPKVV